MKKVYDLLTLIRGEASKSSKTGFLAAEKDNLDLRRFLEVTYDPRTNFWMRKVFTEHAQTASIFAPALESIDFNRDLIDNILQQISTRVLSGDEAKQYIANIHRSLKHDYERELLEYMIQRDVRCGFSSATINKVWPGLIGVVPYSRCSLVSDLPKSKALSTWPWDKGIYSNIKADGMFAIGSHVKDDKKHIISIGSRNGSPFPTSSLNFTEIVEDVKKYIPAGWQALGELLIFRNGVMLERAIGNGIFNTILQGGDLGASDRIIYQVWDMIPNEKAVSKGKYTVPYSERFTKLINLLKDSKDSSIRLIEWKMVYTLQEAYDHSREVMLRGLEGTVIKHPDMIWEDGDSRYQIKLKLAFICDLKITGLVPGSAKGRHANTFGSIECWSSDNKLKVNVGGITDKNRQEIFDNWETENTIRGSIMAVESNGVQFSENSDTASLFLPRCKEIRNIADKSEADSLEEVLKQQEDAKGTANSVGLDSKVIG